MSGFVLGYAPVDEVESNEDNNEVIESNEIKGSNEEDDKKVQEKKPQELSSNLRTFMIILASVLLIFVILMLIKSIMVASENSVYSGSVYGSGPGTGTMSCPKPQVYYIVKKNDETAGLSRDFGDSNVLPAVRSAYNVKPMDALLR